MSYEYESNGACPFCGLRGCGHDRTKYQGPFVDAPEGHTVADLAPTIDVIARDDSARSDEATSAYDDPVEPPPTVVPITPHVGVERVLQVIEKRAKRKKAEQGSLF